MTIVITEGFEYYISNSDPITFLTIEKNWRFLALNGSPSNLVSYEAGKDSRQAVQFSVSTDVRNAVARSVSLTSFATGAHIKGGANGTGYMNIFRVQSPNGSLITLRAKGITAASPGFGVLEVVVNGVVHACSTGTVLASATWYYVELQVEITSGGTVDIVARVDGSEVGNFTGLTGITAGPYTWIEYAIGKTSGSTYNQTFSYDNLYVTDGELLGPIEINTIIPSADTVQKQWTASTGSSNYAMLDDAINTGFSDNVSSTTPGSYDLYDMTTYSLPVGKGIIGIVPNFYVKGSPQGGEPVRVNLETSSTVINGPTTTIVNASGQFVNDPVLTENPVTGMRWTQSDLDNLKAGPEWPTV